MIKHCNESIALFCEQFVLQWISSFVLQTEDGDSKYLLAAKMIPTPTKKKGN